MRARSAAEDEVRAALPAPLADAVVSAGLDGDRLTVGVVSAAWAARLRYQTEALRTRVTTTLGVEVRSVRIKVVPPAA